MPLTACPECRHVAVVHFEQLGHRTRCPNCGETFRPERLPVSFQRIFRAGHPFGVVIGTLMLLAGLGLGGAVFWAGLEPTLAMKVALNIAAIGFVVGTILVIRHIRAVASRPQAVNRQPLAGPTGLHHGSKRV
jgi:hypothetical protein